MSSKSHPVLAILPVLILAAALLFLVGCSTNARALVMSYKTTGIEFPSYGTVEKSYAGEGADSSRALVEIKLDDSKKKALEKKMEAVAEISEGVPVPDMDGYAIRKDLDEMEEDCVWRLPDQDGVFIVLAHDEDGQRYLFYFQS